MRGFVKGKMLKRLVQKLNQVKNADVNSRTLILYDFG